VPENNEKFTDNFEQSLFYVHTISLEDLAYNAFLLFIPHLWFCILTWSVNTIFLFSDDNPLLNYSEEL
jgi:hypothetical protein